jgi:hypothetical protein
MGSRADLDGVVKRKNSQPLPGLEPPIIQPVAIIIIIIIIIIISKHDLYFEITQK